MKCPICETEAINKDSQAYCPSCKIYPGNLSDSYRISEHGSKMADLEERGKVFKERYNRGFIIKVSIIFFTVFIVVTGIGLFMLNFTAYGYREKVFYRYGFTSEARSYLRSGYFEVANIFEEKPLGLSHSGYWKANTNSIRLNTANNEVAIHEFAHSWYDNITVKRGDFELIKSLISDTIKLSQMEDGEYEQTINSAQWIINAYCSCPNIKNVDFKKVDNHHFYAHMAEFTMGKYKEGPHKLPEFMWKYFDGLFSGNLKVTPCYETKGCYFPWNNDPTKARSP